MTENTVLDKNTSSIIKFKDETGNNYPERKSKRLLDLCDSISDGDWIESKDQSESGIRLIQTGNIGIGIFYDKGDKAKYISEKTFKQLHCKEVVCGDILVSRLPDPAGRCCIIPDTISEKMITAVDCTIIRVGKNISSKYILQYMCCEKYFSNVQALLAGGTRQRISRKNLEKISIPVPCLEEQEKIASFLTSIDNIISTQESKISTLETYNRGLLNDIFERKIKFKNEDGEKYPNWEEKPLSEEFPFIRNGFVGIVTDHFSDKEHGIRYIEGTNIHNGRIDDNVEVYVTKEFHQKHKKNELKSDDIVMVQSGHVGDCAVVGSKYAGSNCHALIIMSNGGKVDSRYVAKYFLSDVGKKNLEILKTGNTVKHILSSDMNKFRLPFPCLEEQQKIADCLSAIDKVVEQEKVYLEQLKTIKKGLLQQMFV